MQKLPAVFQALLITLALPIAGNAQTLFEQPDLSGIAGHFTVPLAFHPPMSPPRGEFGLILWQVNPHTPDGLLVPTAWPAGDKTGFYPPNPGQGQQLAFEDRPGSSTVQIGGDAVGAYVNSADLTPTDPARFNPKAIPTEMMITPQYHFPVGKEPHPFAKADRQLCVSLELQTPVAVDAGRPGNITYVTSDLLLVDPVSKVRFSYGTGLFFHHHPNSPGAIGFDIPSSSVMVNCSLGPYNQWASPTLRSSLNLGDPWKGWKLFEYTVSVAQFRAALSAYKEKNPSGTASLEPADYALEMFHLNAEIQYGAAPAELGWSMRKLKVELR